MTILLNSLSERREEFDSHYSLALALQDRLLAGDVSIGETELSTRHLLTLKSGLLVHIYNIVEATMTSITNLVGDAIGSVSPRNCAENSLKEWLRESVVNRSDNGEDNRLITIHAATQQLLKNIPLGSQKFKKPSGTWSDKLIHTFAERLGVDFKLPEEMWRRISPRTEFRDESPLQFLAERRNAIAHGRRTFEEGANDLTIEAIREIADVTLDYLELAISAFQNHIANNKHLVAV